MAKQTTITIETRSLLIIQAGRSHRAWCPHCSAEADMLAVDSTSAVSDLDAATLRAWLQSGDVHRCAGPEGATLICLGSLWARMRVGKNG